MSDIPLGSVWVNKEAIIMKDGYPTIIAPGWRIKEVNEEFCLAEWGDFFGVVGEITTDDLLADYVRIK